MNVDNKTGNATVEKSAGESHTHTLVKNYNTRDHEASQDHVTSN